MHEEVEGKKRRKSREKTQLKKPKPTVGDFHRDGKAICSGAEFAANAKWNGRSLWAEAPQIFIASVPLEGGAPRWWGGGQSGDCGANDVAAGVRRTDRRLSWHSGRLFVHAFLFKFTGRLPATFAFQSAHCLSARLGLLQRRERRQMAKKVAECVTLGFACHLSRHEVDKIHTLFFLWLNP